MISLKARGWTQPMEYISPYHKVYFRWSKKNNQGSDGRPTVKQFLLSHTVQELPQHLFLMPTSAPPPLFSALVTTRTLDIQLCVATAKSLWVVSQQPLQHNSLTEMLRSDRLATSNSVAEIQTRFKTCKAFPFV